MLKKNIWLVLFHIAYYFILPIQPQKGSRVKQAIFTRNHRIVAIAKNFISAKTIPKNKVIETTILFFSLSIKRIYKA